MELISKPSAGKTEVLNLFYALAKQFLELGFKFFGIVYGKLGPNFPQSALSVRNEQGDVSCPGVIGKSGF